MLSVVVRFTRGASDAATCSNVNQEIDVAEEQLCTQLFAGHLTLHSIVFSGSSSGSPTYRPNQILAQEGGRNCCWQENLGDAEH